MVGRMRSAVLVTLAAGMLAAPAVASAALPFGPRLLLANGAFTSRDPAIATSTNGHAVAAWTQSGGPKGVHQIFVSDLSATGWSAPVAVPGSDDGEDPVVAVSPNGNAAVAWTASNALKASVRRRAARAFSAAQTLGSRSSASDVNSDASLAVNDAGVVVAGWRHFDAGSTSHWAEASFASTGAFTAAAKVGQTASSVSALEVAIDAAGHAVLLYQAPGADGDDDTMQALGSGGAFAAPTAIGSRQTGDLHIAANANGTLIAAWSEVCDDDEEDCPEVFYVEGGSGTVAGGITSQQRLSNPGNGDAGKVGVETKHADGPALGIDAQGNAFVTWDTVNEPAGHSNQYGAWFAAGSWAPTFELPTIPDLSGFAHEQAVSVASGHALLTLRQDSAGNGKGRVDYLTADVGGTFSAAAGLNGSGNGDSSVSSLAANGVATVLWRDVDMSSDGIAARTTQLFPQQPAPPNWAVLPTKIAFSATGTAAAGTVSCPGWYVSCAYKVSIGPRAGVLATGSASLQTDGTRKLTLKLTPLGMRTIMAGPPVKRTFDITVTGPNGRVRTEHASRLVLRRR